MTRPNITDAKLKTYLGMAAALITTTINEHVDSGRITRAEADKYLSTSIKQITYPVYVVAIRGYYMDTMGKAGQNDRGIYDDAMVLVGPNFMKTFNANTDPRKFGEGIAQLLPGLHYFKQGLHGYNRGPYKAFRTANAREVLPVLRDGQNGIKDGITINLHKGGKYETNSIACQTVQADQWPEFQIDAYNLMNKEGQHVLPYLLLEP